MSEAFSHRTETADGVVWRGEPMRSVLVSTALLFVMALAALLIKMPDHRGWVLALGLPFGALAFASNWAYQHRRLVVGSTGMTFVGIRGSRFIAWSSLARVDVKLVVHGNTSAARIATVAEDGGQDKFALNYLPHAQLPLIPADIAAVAGVRVKVLGATAPVQAFDTLMWQRYGNPYGPGLGEPDEPGNPFI